MYFINYSITTPINNEDNIDVDELIGQLLSSEKLDLLVERITDKALDRIRQFSIVRKAKDFESIHSAVHRSTHNSIEKGNENESYVKGPSKTFKMKSNKIRKSLKAGNFRLKFKHLAKNTTKTSASPMDEVSSYVELNYEHKSEPKQEIKQSGVDVINLSDENNSFLNYSRNLVKVQDDYLQKIEENEDPKIENTSDKETARSQKDNLNGNIITAGIFISGSNKKEKVTTIEPQDLLDNISDDSVSVDMKSSAEELSDPHVKYNTDRSTSSSLKSNNHLPFIKLIVNENMDKEVSTVNNNTTTKKIIRQEGNKLFTFDSSSEYQEYHEEYKRSGGNNEYFAF